VPRGQFGRRAQRLVGIGDAVMFLEAQLESEENVDRLRYEGSTTSIFWKRRARAWSFSKIPRYSW